MVLESFPQFLISLFIMQALKLTEILNIFSCTVSGLSVLYGLGDFLALQANDSEPDYPISKAVWGVLSILIDTLLRSFTISYWMTISKAYVILVPVVYGVLFVAIFTIKEGDFSVSRIASTAVASLTSLGCSSLEENERDYRLRPISKSIFAAIFIAFSIFFGLTAAPKVFANDITVSNQTIVFQPSNCTNLCQQTNQTEQDYEAMTDYCNDLWEHIPSESFTHQTICIVLATLFVLSTLEGTVYKLGQ